MYINSFDYRHRDDMREKKIKFVFVLFLAVLAIVGSVYFISKSAVRQGGVDFASYSYDVPSVDIEDEPTALSDRP